MTKFKATVHTGSVYLQDGKKQPINFHKLPQDKNDSGKWAWDYWGLSDFNSRYKEWQAKLNPTGLARLDIALDRDCPYTETEKQTRYALLCFAEVWGDKSRRYRSDDPYTLIPLTVRIANGDNNHRTLEVESYNRDNKPQKESTYRVINRLELRAMGTAVKDKDAATIARDWIERWNALDTKATAQKLEAHVNAAIIADIKRHPAANQSGKHLVAAAQAHERDIYTRRQLLALADALGINGKNIADKQRAGGAFNLLEKNALNNERAAIVEALEEFIKT